MIKEPRKLTTHITFSYKLGCSDCKPSDFVPPKRVAASWLDELMAGLFEGDIGLVSASEVTSFGFVVVGAVVVAAVVVVVVVGGSHSEEKERGQTCNCH